ncbi:hypothetical protein EDD21DRAFT_359308 [Dissophora ornata]|nr:hypothetical protein EDD21DRAFT_359308 [Dissophora ornata]
MLDRPFTDVCCTVSCWALLFSVIIPTMQAMGVEATAFSHWDSRQHHHQQQQQHLHLQQFHHLNHRQQQHSLMKPQTFALTVYLESNPQGLFALPILANPSGTPSPQNQGQEDQHHLQCQHLQSHHPFKVYANNGRSTTDQSTRTKRPALPAAQIQRNGCRRNVRTVIVSKKCSDPISHLQLNAGKRATVHGHCGPLKLSRHQYPQALLQGLDRALPSTSISTSTSSSVSTSSPGSPMVQEDKQNVQRAIDESVNDDNTIYSTMRSLAMAAGMQLPKYSDDLSPQTSIPPASLFAAWTKNDLGFARALWDYWQELDALNRIQMELEEQLSNELDHSFYSMLKFTPV